MPPGARRGAGARFLAGDALGVAAAVCRFAGAGVRAGGEGLAVADLDKVLDGGGLFGGGVLDDVEAGGWLLSGGKHAGCS